MRLSLFEADRRKHYEAIVWEVHGYCLYFEFYSTKNEAIKAVKAYKKSYKGNKKLDCYVKLVNKNWLSIKDYDI